VDAKRNRRDRPVGVGVVRQLYGVVEAMKTSAGLLATTSFFSPDAKQFQEKIPFRLTLRTTSTCRRCSMPLPRASPAAARGRRGRLTRPADLDGEVNVQSRSKTTSRSPTRRDRAVANPVVRELPRT
jgi:hypothetical protein